MEKNRSFTINKDTVENLKQRFTDCNIGECVHTLDALIDFAEKEYGTLSEKLANPNITEEEKKDLLKKITIAERKFRHMLDVPNLCVTRAREKSYSDEQALLLTTIGIMHDIGRVHEIVGVESKDCFKNKINHAQLGADYILKAEDVVLPSDHIHDFISEELVSKYASLIYNCVKYHGSLNIPTDKFSTELSKMLIHEIRLIDKSSIMNSFLVEDISTVIGVSVEELNNTSISDTTYSELVNFQQVNRKKEGEEYTPNRHFMSHVGFIYDMDDYSLLTPDWVTKYINIYDPALETDKEKKEKIRQKAITYMNR